MPFKKGDKYWLGKKRLPFSKEWKKKISESKKGKHHSKETKMKIGNAHRGSKSFHWTGGIWTTKHGYLYVKDYNHPFRNSKNYIAQHRLIMEKYFGRFLDRNEEVHHKNGIKDDNRIENLEIVIKKVHFGNVKCPYCLHDFKIK